jgi:hypothetical protein
MLKVVREIRFRSFLTDEVSVKPELILAGVSNFPPQILRRGTGLDYKKKWNLS